MLDRPPSLCDAPQRTMSPSRTWLALAIGLAGCCFSPSPGPPVQPATGVAPIALDLTPLPFGAAPYDHPSWGLSTTALASSREHLPQLLDASARFGSAPPTLELGSFSGLLICRVLLQPGGSWDLLAGGPDLYLGLRAGANVVVTDEGRGDGVFTVPVVDLAPGTSVSFELDDHDLLFDDQMATGTVEFAGRSPLLVSLGGDAGGMMECRAAEPAGLGREVEQALASLDRAIIDLGQPSADLQHGTLGWPVVDAIAVRERLVRVLALAGFTHPETLARLSRLDGIVSGYRRSLGDAVGATLAALPPRGAPVTLPDGTSATPSFACGPETAGMPPAIVAAAAAPCVVSLRFRASGAFPLTLIGLSPEAQSLVIDSDGGVASLGVVGATYGASPDLVMPPRDATNEEVTLWWSATPPSDGSVVSLALGGGRRVTLRP